jgi:4-amino-4-deoxy-L-arabinose transferase-like glycosyltransferase
MTRFDPWICAALLVAVAIRLAGLADAALWFDETFTASWVRLPWVDMLRTLLADNHLPLYFIVEKAWISLVGISPWTLRFPSVIFSLAIVPLTAAIAWTLKGRTAARWAAWFAAISPYLLQHAQDARMYAMLGALAAVNTLLLARFLSGKSTRLGWAFLLANGALLATHYYSVFFVAAEALALLLVAASRWRSWGSSMAASCLLVVGPVLCAKYLATPHAGGSYEMGLLALPGMIWSVLSGSALIPSSAEVHARGIRAAMSYLPIAIPALAALLVAGVAAARSLSRTGLLLLAAIVGTVLLGPFAVSLIFDVGVNPRYAMACTPALLAFIAAGAPETMGQRWRSAAAVVLVLFMIGASALHLAQPGHGREDVYAVGRWLQANVPAEEEILVTSEEMLMLAQFHWPQRHFKLYPARRTVAGAGNADQLAANVPFANPNRAIYMFGREWLSDPDGALRAALRAHYAACPGMDARGIQIFCLTLPRK